MESNLRRTTRTTAMILLLALVLCGSGAAYLFRTGISKAFSDMKLVPTPEPYTELYFDNAGSLPTSTLAGRPIDLSFTIHNMEGTSTVYPYVVYFQGSNGTSLVFTKGITTLPDGASTSISVTHQLQTVRPQGKIVVNLTSKNQQIDFLINHPNE